MAGNQAAPAREIDWAGIHRRLAAWSVALERGGTPDEETTRRILHRRGLELAKPPVREDDGERLELLEFTVGAERYGFETSAVAEVLALNGLTAVPKAPAFIAGVTTVRGQVLPLVDLGRLLDLGGVDRADLRRVVVLGQAPGRDGGALGLLVTSIIGVAWVPRAKLQAAPSVVTGRQRHYLTGIVPPHLALLDARRLLADPDLIVGGRPSAQSG
ncbi:chemotaxis protein CheW [Nitrospirillum iridis]|uniref:Purine-binding chemotaxis protein CheW n=1 Tax=Nitrospirillum iridis TaxID=765888 RepID=A0A7X0AVR9_9PROT|nr:chemotaxis protein CheW [Nitrospirillum iridis]MBB6251032.1 purine-binding chemotaxis protein CheW [Nitrospirillum iridis]